VAGCWRRWLSILSLAAPALLVFNRNVLFLEFADCSLKTLNLLLFGLKVFKIAIRGLKEQLIVPLKVLQLVMLIFTLYL
jgi:hypothetical protein